MSTSQRQRQQEFVSDGIINFENIFSDLKRIIKMIVEKNLQYNLKQVDYARNIMTAVGGIACGILRIENYIGGFIGYIVIIALLSILLRTLYIKGTYSRTL